MGEQSNVPTVHGTICRLVAASESTVIILIQLGVCYSLSL